MKREISSLKDIASYSIYIYIYKKKGKNIFFRN